MEHEFDRMSDVIHDSVCEFTHTDGVGQCYWTTIAAWWLLRQQGQNWLPCVGSLSLLIDPPDGMFTMDASDGGMDRMEFHCWLIQPSPEILTTGSGMPLAWLDFTARYWKELTVRTQRGIVGTLTDDQGTLFLLDPHQERIPWTQVDPPKYLWCEHPPEWVGYRPDRDAMRQFFEGISQHTEVRNLLRIVSRRWTSRRHQDRKGTNCGSTEI